jgi:hypothetical protein
MSHILLKQVPSSSIATPGSTDIKIFSNFNDNGVLYYVDNSGNELPVGLSNTPVVSTTYGDLYNLYTSGNFATGSYYLITDFYTVYEQPAFYFDETLLSQGVTKTTPVRPLLVLATTYNTLSPYATQPGFPKDKIKYDITWNRTEFNHGVRGRITERIDEYNNRTDYDHRSVRFRRYKNYIKDTQLTGTITDWNCVTGAVIGSSTLFNTELSPNDVIFLDSKSDKGYDIGLKVVSISSPTSMTVVVHSLYTGGVPSTVTLYNGISQIIPVDYSFNSKNYDFWSSFTNGDYDSHKEIYFGQSDSNIDYDEYYTFDSGTYNNNISDFSKYYLSGNNNVLILSNNVFLDSSNNNLISGDFYYNTIKSICTSNFISGKMYANSLGVLRNNQISGDFYNNINFLEISYNIFTNLFVNNIGDGASEFRMNKIYCSVAGQDFTSSTYVYGAYNCDIFANNGFVAKLSYYDIFNVLNIANVNA